MYRRGGLSKMQARTTDDLLRQCMEECGLLQEETDLFVKIVKSVKEYPVSEGFEKDLASEIQQKISYFVENQE